MDHRPVPWCGGGAGEQRRVGGSSGTSSYQEFFDLCEAAQNAEGSIEALKEERDPASAARRSQIDQSITALKATRIESINEYNSKAAQEHRAPFRDQDLPYRLNAGADKTTCAK